VSIRIALKFLVMFCLLCVLGHKLQAQASSCKIQYQFCGICGDKLIPGSSCEQEITILSVCTVGTFKCDAICWDCLAASSNSAGGTPHAGKPINLATGDTFITQSDLSIPGLGGGLSLSRTWHSQFPFGESASINGMFGRNWRSTYEESIFVDGDGMVKYVRGSGGIWTLGLVSASWPLSYAMVAPANGNLSLSFDGNYWTLTSNTGEKRVFYGSTGQLLSLSDRNGNTTQLSYDGSNRLTTVTDPASRHLYFSYASSTSNEVIGVTSDVGISLSYAYDSMGRLSTVTQPDTTTLSFQYVDDPLIYNSDFLISAVLDTNGKVLEAHSYDGMQRGVTSSRAGGVDAVTINYPFFLAGSQ